MKATSSFTTLAHILSLHVSILCIRPHYNKEPVISEREGWTAVAETADEIERENLPESRQ